MKNPSRSLIIGACVLVLPQLASATLLVGYANFTDINGNTSNNSANPNGSATESVADVTGSYQAGGNLLLGPGLANPWWSGSGKYGADPATPITVTDTNTSLGTNGNVAVTFTMNASLGAAYTLNNFILEVTTGSHGGSSYTLDYAIPGGASGNLANVTYTNWGDTSNPPASGGWTGQSISLSSIAGTFGVDFSKIVFTLTSANGGVDNAGVTGILTAIPETGSLLALGCLVGSGTLLRRRGPRR